MDLKTTFLHFVILMIFVLKNVEPTDICSKCKCSEFSVECSTVPLGPQIPVPLFQNEDNVITSLNMTSCQLTTIDNFMFTSFKFLEILDLSRNSLELEKFEFRNLDNLRVLNLSSNNLTTLWPKMFHRLKFLTELILTGNPIKYVKPSTFTYLANLKILNLANIDMDQFMPNVFQHVPNLEHLDISDNNMIVVPNNELRRLKHLKFLNVGGNDITETNERSFKGLSSLVELRLDGLAILTRIGEFSFSDLTSLRSLSIEFCPKLRSIAETAFWAGDEVEDRSLMGNLTISFRNSSMQSLSSVVMEWCQIKALDLSGNPWECDCLFTWAKNCTNLVNRDQVRCRGPEPVRNLPLWNVSESDMQCVSHSALHMEEIESIVRASFGVLTSAIVLFALSVVVLVGVIVGIVTKNDIKEWWRRKRHGHGSKVVYYAKTSTNEV